MIWYLATAYLQTWHGTPLKKLANDMDEVHIPEPQLKSINRILFRIPLNGII
ncbi:CDP-glycerol glycerophosphotransferase family protein [Bacillus vallismortis]|uniref:CDP-glycerol glycerophosphotransferase family protein n=1 Tax=Bacillus vallismortis TaxID=72361 RepID=UPI00227E80AE|nr:CDP-glycerol glycerophosphotransferase family protein [Bacillus vallismortis]MCY7916892.1 CDP-glycerol glycerophosphotransferase family protein [Bacillus vallismortis]